LEFLKERPCMGKATGFMEYARESYPERDIPKRLHDYKEIYLDFPNEALQKQGARCMDCGVPFCHQGCPLGNLIPEWNDLIYKNRWKDAIVRLHATNNFPEFTGLLCPAPCEGACVLGINEKPVSIKYIEFNIIKKAFEEGWIKPEPPKKLTGKKVAVVGSGPAGMACAWQLRKVGHDVTVFERADRIGGLLRYGIPDFKMEKYRIDLRVKQMSKEGVIFKTSVHIGGPNYPVQKLTNEFDAIALCMGATNARELAIPGRELNGIHLAMDYLTQQNKKNAGDKDLGFPIDAKGKNVIILGGGDTGADCLGTVHRQGEKSVVQIELLPKPPDERASSNPWPQWPMVYRVSPAHHEGGDRLYSIMTKKFSGENGQVKKLHLVHLGPSFVEIPGSEETLDADLVLLALGFVGPDKKGLLTDLGLTLDARGNVATNAKKQTNIPQIFAAGDVRRGASLVVWAIAEGRQCAKSIDEYLMGASPLPD